jgi:hypothetical protein
MDDDPLTDLDAARPRAERRDRARVLVPERERQLVGDGAGGPVMHQVEVAVAEPGRLDFNQDLSRPGLGLTDLDQLRVGFPPSQLDCPHLALIV